MNQTDKESNQNCKNMGKGEDTSSNKQQQKMDLIQFINNQFSKSRKEQKQDQQNIQFLRNAQVKTEKQLEQVMKNQLQQHQHQQKMNKELTDQIKMLKGQMDEQNQLLQKMKDIQDEFQKQKEQQQQLQKQIDMVRSNNNEPKMQRLQDQADQIGRQQDQHERDIKIIKKVLGLSSDGMINVDNDDGVPQRMNVRNDYPQQIQEDVFEENNQLSEKQENENRNGYEYQYENGYEQPMRNSYLRSMQFDQSAVLSERQPAPRKENNRIEMMRESNILGENLDENEIKNSSIFRSRKINHNNKQLNSIYGNVKSQDKKELIGIIQYQNHIQQMYEIEQEPKIQDLNINKSQLQSIPLKENKEQQELDTNSKKVEENPNDKNIQCSLAQISVYQNGQQNKSQLWGNRNEQYTSRHFNSQGVNMVQSQVDYQQYFSQNDIISLNQDPTNPCQLKFDNVPQYVVQKFLDNLNQYKNQWVLKQTESIQKSNQMSSASPSKNNQQDSDRKQHLFNQFYEEDNEEQLLPQRDEKDRSQSVKQNNSGQKSSLQQGSQKQGIGLLQQTEQNQQILQQRSQDEQYVRAFNQSFKDKDSIQILSQAIDGSEHQAERNNINYMKELGFEQSAQIQDQQPKYLESQHIRQNDRIQDLNDQIQQQLQQQLSDYQQNPNMLPSVHNSQLNSQFLNYNTQNPQKEYQQYNSRQSSVVNVKYSQMTMGSQFNHQLANEVVRNVSKNKEHDKQQQLNPGFRNEQQQDSSSQMQQKDQKCCNEKCDNKVKKTGDFFLSQQFDKQACNQCKKSDLVQKAETIQKNKEKEQSNQNSNNNNYLQQMQNLEMMSNHSKQQSLIDKLENKERKNLVESVYDETIVENNNADEIKNQSKSISNSKVNIPYPYDEKQSIDSYIKEKYKNAN